MTTFVKSLALILTAGLFSFGISEMALDQPSADSILLQDEAGITFPENVKAIVDAKCMGCHKPDARNEKAREKLQWEKVPKMNKEEQEHLIAELFEVLEEGKMPPKKVVERRPQMKLTDEETKTLLAWAEVEEKRLKGQ